MGSLAIWDTLKKYIVMGILKSPATDILDLWNSVFFFLLETEHTFILDTIKKNQVYSSWNQGSETEEREKLTTINL